MFTQITTSEEKQRVLELEPFDEFEEWHLKCCHYVLVIASNGELRNWIRLKQEHSDLLDPRTLMKWHTTSVSRELQRFGHRAVSINYKACVVGGFGPSAEGNRRCKTVSVFDATSNSELCVNEYITSDSECDLMYCTACCLSDNRILIFGGRRSPLKLSEEMVILHMNMTGTDSSEFQDKVKIEKYSLTGNTPCPRWRHSAGVYPTHGNEQVLVFGGRTINNKVR